MMRQPGRRCFSASTDRDTGVRREFIRVRASIGGGIDQLSDRV